MRSFTIPYKKILQILRRRLEHIYRQIRNAEPPDEETARGIIDKLFFSEQRYSLGEFGRYRLNKKLYEGSEEDSQVLTKGYY